MLPFLQLRNGNSRSSYEIECARSADDPKYVHLKTVMILIFIYFFIFKYIHELCALRKREFILSLDIGVYCKAKL